MGGEAGGGGGGGAARFFPKKQKNRGLEGDTPSDDGLALAILIFLQGDGNQLWDGLFFNPLEAEIYV